MWSEFFILYVVCRRSKCVYKWIVEGQIVYRVYTYCIGENNIYVCFSSKVNHVSESLGGYRFVQPDM
jgi:hypothetical protein